MLTSKALSKNGKILNGNIMIGVCQCINKVKVLYEVLNIHSFCLEHSGVECFLHAFVTDQRFKLVDMQYIKLLPFLKISTVRFLSNQIAFHLKFFYCFQ